MPAFRLAVPAAANRLARARGAITSLCEELRMEPATIERVRASVTEACANCIQHAYDGECECETFVIEAETGDGELIIRVSDRGRGIADVEERRLDGGFGFELIEGLADAHEITQLEEGGICVVLRFALL
jgi:anti-sigma regulatory factor (Ser/Thr protein kinase)